LNDIGAGDVAEQLVINKLDHASGEAVTTLRHLYPDAIFVSARTGEGIDELRALIPYDRGDLIDRIHRHGQFITTEHTGEGTRVVVRVHPDLAGELAHYVE
ncbi:MAG TPA: GTPase HflX, partial [Propionibacteriaceae bacterium]|nr:GTPase HflX [Propionibacteriaceae bacterium]